MTKGIIVVDMPKSCSECPSFCGFYSDMNCRAMNNRTINYPYPDSFRQSWCPIKPMPEKRTINYLMDDVDMDAAGGRNDCIDEILEGESDGQTD